MKQRNMLNLTVELLVSLSFKPASEVMLRMRCLATQKHHINNKLKKLKAKQKLNQLYVLIKILVPQIKCSDI